jgi:ribosomal protein S18 acetylase RimI-like enzyme
MNATVKSMEANLWDNLAYLAKTRKESVVQDTPDLLLIDSGLPNDRLNKIGRCAVHPRYGAERIEAAINHFRKKETPVPFTWTVGPLSGHGSLEATLTDLGLKQVGERWGMVAQLKDLHLPASPLAGLSVNQVETKKGVEEFATILAAATKPPNPHITNFYTDAAPSILMPNAPMKLYVGAAGTTPVAAGEAYYSHGMVGLSNIVMDPAAAGKGYAPALMLELLRAAKRSGQSIAFVQADASTKPIYERLGFKPAGQFSDFRLMAN